MDVILYSKIAQQGAEINTIQDSTAQSDGFLDINDFDCSLSGKTNTLLTPYDYDTDGFLNNSIILKSGAIRTEGSTADNYCVISPLIAVNAGTYGLKTSYRSTVGDIYVTNGGFGLFASDGTTVVSKPSARVDLGNDIYLFEVPDTAAYIRFVITKGSTDDTNLAEAVEKFNEWILLPGADSSIDDSFFVLSEPKENGTIDRIRRADGSYLTLVDSTAQADATAALARPITFGRKTCAIFEKVCCIGDSYTAGYIMNTDGTARSNNAYSWVTHLANATGREYVNCGVSGVTSETWLSNANGLAKMQLAVNKAQAYLIGLQINDAQTGLTVGTTADIGTDTVSYYGCMSKIIDEIFTVNDAAHVFIQTQPKNYTGAHTPYREALLAIVEWYQTDGNGTHQTQVHLLDLLDYYKLYQNAGCNDSMVNGHFTAVGWEYCAEILMYAWSTYINEHPLYFQDVNLIPYGTSE